jgi:ubiquinone/menaquinone biosynthesis C-methylase UbiE
MSKWNKKLGIMRRYDSTAHIYDMRYSEEQTAKVHAALESVTVKKHSIILDAGCGTGLLFDHVAEKAEMIVGLDISRNILLLAKERSRKFTNVHLILADADNLPFADEVFSHAFAITLIQNMPNPAETLKELERATKNDAIIVVTGLKKKFSLEAFMRLLHKTGLSKIEIKNENLKCYVAICFKIH